MNNLIIKIHRRGGTITKKEVGGKAFSLIDLSNKRIPVPDGFIITTRAYDLFLKNNNLTKKIEKVFSINLKKSNQDEIDIIREEILNGRIPEKLDSELRSYIKKYNFKHYAVRSSANIEDAKYRSWAGEFESYLNISPKNIINAIKQCWASVFSSRVIDYANNLSQIPKIKMAVILQKSINCDISGVCFTRNPLNIKEDDIRIEAVFGFGETLVQGEIIPDSYKVERGTNIILEVDVNEQALAHKAVNGEGTRSIPIKKTFEQKLLGREIIQLSRLAQKIEKIHGDGRDIEWCKDDNQLYILQSRPITTG